MLKLQKLKSAILSKITILALSLHTAGNQIEKNLIKRKMYKCKHK